MKLDLNNKKFTSKSNSDNGEVSEKTIFQYHQDGKIIWADYGGGEIIKGNLVGKYVEDDFFEFTYQHVNSNFEIMTGKCKSYPQIEDNGKITIKEYWQWTCLDKSTGESTLTEI